MEWRTFVLQSSDMVLLVAFVFALGWLVGASDWRNPSRKGK